MSAALLACCIALAACATPLRQVPEAERLTQPEILSYREAAAALEAGDAARALASIEPLTSRSPWHVPSHMLRQDALVQTGRESEARAWYAAEAAARADDPARALLAARLAVREEGARESAYRAAARDDRSPWPKIALAYELIRRARDEAARAVTLTDDGFSDEAHAALSRAEAAEREAEQSAVDAARRWPELAATQGALADVLLAARVSGRATRAMDATRAAEEAARLDPATASSWERVGRARRALPDDDGAAKAFARAVEIAPRNASFRASLGRALLDLRRDADARNALAAAAQLAPDDASIAQNHAVALHRVGDLAAAAGEFERASRLAPKDPQPHEGLALTRAELGDRAGAAAAMEAYLAAGGLDRDAATRFIEEMKSAAPGR